MSASRAAFGLGLLLAACATRPVDAFVLAERSLARRDLAAALQALDAVPVAHAHYPQARAVALDVERSMRRCHELMLEAMLLRSEWRDADALVALQKVRQIWPEMPGVEVLISATTQRRRLFGEPPVVATTDVPLPAAPPAPSMEVAMAVSAPAAAPVEKLVAVAASAPVAPAVEVAPVVEVAPAPAADGTQDSLVANGLAAIEGRLARGQLEGAVNDLLALAQQFPADARVRVRLVRVLNQRALLRYGDGYLSLAIADWRQVLELDPRNAGARRLLEAAELESH